MNKKASVKDLEFLSTLTQECEDVLVGAVEKTMRDQRESLIAEVAYRLRGCFITRSELKEQEVQGAAWQGVESLSRLRSIVGGRFQNIKKKWTDAGFPLREHRGDRWKDFSLNDEGWLELSNWILKQGFEARLTTDSEEYLFELRKIGG